MLEQIGRTILLCLCIAAFGIAQALAQPASGNGPKPGSVSGAESPIPPRAGDEAKTSLENWLNMAGQFNDRLIATVYWSLSAMIAILVVLVGFGWYQNFRVYDRDKAALLRELRAEITAYREEVAILLRSELTSEIDKRLNEVKSRIEADQAKLASQLVSLKSSIRSDLKDTERDLHYAKIDILKLSASDWAEKGVPVNEIRELTRVLEIVIDKGIATHQIDKCLVRIGDILEAGNVWRGDWEPPLFAMINRMPAQYETLKNRVSKALSKVKIS